MPIRVRLAVLSTVATVLVLSGGGALFLHQLAGGLLSNLDTTLRARADTLVSQVAGDENPDLPDGGPGTLLRTSDTVAQVVTANGDVTEFSDGLAGQHLLSPALLEAAQRAPVSFDATVTLAPSSVVGAQQGPQPLRLLAVPAAPGFVVVVGTGRDPVDGAVERARSQLYVLAAAAVLFAGGGSYLLARSALRPVERMRAQASELGANDAGTALAVPTIQDEIGRLAVTMNALLGRLHAALSRERAFVADAGHELKTPLTVLKGELELAQRPGRTAAELSATIRVVADETDRLIRLTEDLLFLARSEQGPFLRRRITDVRLVLAATQRAYAVPAASRGVTVCVETPSTTGTGQHDPLVAEVDPDRIRQALDNMVSNAVRHSPPGGRVLVGADVTADVLTVHVQDGGTGFPADILPLAFERFRRVDTARTRVTAPDNDRSGEPLHSGLGLAIVHSIAQAHGGTATAANLTAGGARVTLTLPASGPGRSW